MGSKYQSTVSEPHQLRELAARTRQRMMMASSAVFVLLVLVTLLLAAFIFAKPAESTSNESIAARDTAVAKTSTLALELTSAPVLVPTQQTLKFEECNQEITVPVEYQFEKPGQVIFANMQNARSIKLAEELLAPSDLVTSPQLLLECRRVDRGLPGEGRDLNKYVAAQEKMLTDTGRLINIETVTAKVKLGNTNVRHLRYQIKNELGNTEKYDLYLTQTPKFDYVVRVTLDSELVNSANTVKFDTK